MEPVMQSVDMPSVSEQPAVANSMHEEASLVAASEPPPVYPLIDHLIRVSVICQLSSSESYDRAMRSITSSSHPAAVMVDEYYKGVKFSPDGLCILTCGETGENTQTGNRKAKRPKVNSIAAVSSVDSSGSSSSSSSSDSDDDENDDPFPPLPPSDKRGLSMYELPPLKWTETVATASYDSTTQSTPFAPHYSYDFPATDSSKWSPLIRCHPESIYDFMWNPTMNSADPASCFFLSTSRCNPIHAWDAFTGELRASYSAYNQVDELEPAISLCMPPASSGDCSKLYAGFHNSICVFDIERPGREYIRIPTVNKRPAKSHGRRGRRSTPTGMNQNGIISTMAVNPVHTTLLAAGSYNGEVGLYNLNAIGDGGKSGLEHKIFIDSHGVTQVAFSSDGLYLFANPRFGEEIAIYDMRQATMPCSKLNRGKNGTNQRFYFDIDQSYSSRFLFCGDAEGNLRGFDLNAPPNEDDQLTIAPRFTQRVSRDALHGVSLHPSWNSTVPIIATTSGGRMFILNESENCDETETASSNMVLEAPPTNSTNSVSESTSTKKRALDTASIVTSSSSAPLSKSSLPLNCFTLLTIDHSIAPATTDVSSLTDSISAADEAQTSN